MLIDERRPTESLAESLAESQTQSPVALPAGGDDPARFDWKEAWYPVYYIDDLDRSKPAKFTLLDRDLVIWWDRTTGQWRAFDDQCPHRLAPLSEGRIAEDGLLECPYHGWAFRGDGGCDRIPQQPADSTAHTSPRACVAALPTTVRQGLLFVYAGTPERAAAVAVPTIAPLEDDPDGWVCLNTFRDLPYDALTLLENVLDASHVPFTHHRSVGNRANASTVDLEVVETGKQGFTGTWAEGPRKGTLGRQDTTFIAPALMWHDLTSKQFGRTLTVVYATPIRKGECRVFARFPFKFASKLPAFLIQLSPQWYSHLGQNSVLEDDQIFLHYQERYLNAKGGSSNFAKAFYLPTRADYFVSELRKWVNHYEADPFTGQPLPPPRSTEALLDRYHSHTQHCASCRRALATTQQIKLAVVIVGAIAWASLPLTAIALGTPPLAIALLATLTPLIAGLIWAGLHKLERQFYQGRPIPLRNMPEKKPKKK
ncbi:MAG TPA: Rieske 2Fe-2S domain-containing protein [Chroococcidiopsis sp.]